MCGCVALYGFVAARQKPSGGRFVRTLMTPKQTITIIRVPYKTNAVDRRDDSMSYAVSSLCSQFIYLLFLFVSCVVAVVVAAVVVAVAYLAICIILFFLCGTYKGRRTEIRGRTRKRENDEWRKTKRESGSKLQLLF